MAASGTTAKKAPRQPIYWPRKLPERRRDRGRKRVAAVEQTKSARHLGFRHKAHDRRRRHRPEPADDDADERPSRHEDRRVRREGDHHAREDHHQREAQQHRAAVDAAGYAGDRQAGQDGEEP